MIDFVTHVRPIFFMKNIQNICGHKSETMWCMELKVGMSDKHHRHSNNTKFHQNLLQFQFFSMETLMQQFSTDWPTDYIYLMPSDKCNSKWLYHCSMSLRSEMCLSANHSSSSACIIVLPKLTFPLHYTAPFLSN